jgi:hypothetical protein
MTSHVVHVVHGVAVLECNAYFDIPMTFRATRILEVIGAFGLIAHCTGEYVPRFLAGAYSMKAVDTHVVWVCALTTRYDIIYVRGYVRYLPIDLSLRPTWLARDISSLAFIA